MRCCFGIAVVLTFWTLAAEGQDETSISGIVVSDVRDSLIPINTVRVELHKQSDAAIEIRATDDAGRYAFANLLPGSYDLKLAAPPGGFEPRLVEIKGIDVNSGERKELPTIRLSWAGTCQAPIAPSQITILRTASAPKVTGIVDEFKGSVLSNVHVQLRSYADLHHPVSMTTGADGHYEFRNVAPGKYTISTQAPGLHDQGFDIYVYPGFDVVMPNARVERCETLDCVRPFGLCE